MPLELDDGEAASCAVLPSAAQLRPSAISYVDLYLMQAWLTIDGRVIRGPVPVRAGGPGKETPIGRFTVLWKEQLHFSSECNNTPMPYSVFFTSGGVAFHSGNMERPSAGCLKLSLDDAEAWYSTLEVGDEVWIHGSESRAERACRIGLAPEECGPVGNSELAR